MFPLLIAIYFYKLFILFSYAASHYRPSFLYEIFFYFVYLFYYVDTHLFFVTICSSTFFPKLFNKKRRLRSFSTSKLLAIVEKFFPNNEFFKMLVQFSAVTPLLLFIMPAIDLFIFYIIFVLIIICIIKIIVDF